VWTGNFSGGASAELTGAEVATPLMFEIFRYINKNNKTWFAKPAHLQTRFVDQQTGLLPGEFTNGLVEDYYIPLVSKVDVSDNYVRVNVSLDENISYCKDCLPGANYKLKIYPKIAPELQSYYEKYSIPYEHIPPHNPKCLKIAKGTPPVISCPYNGQEYILEKNNGQKILLQCSTKNDINDVYWFINDKFFIKVRQNEKVFFQPEKPGNYKISCSDDLGRNTDINIKVTFY
jgi:penicillin-binding protein 1C